MSTKTHYTEFKSRFRTICEAHGGVFDEKGSIGFGSEYVISTAWGPLRVAIFDDTAYQRPTKRRNLSPIQSIYMQFREYTGPVEFPLHGDFNQFSHKWNILISSPGKDIQAVRDYALKELETRLELLKECT